MKKLSGLALRWLILAIVAAVAIIAYWVFSANYVYTGDAFVNMLPYTISSNVSGFVDDVYVHESEKVAKGQLLLRLKQTPYLDLYNEAKANYETARQARLQILKTVAAYEKLYKISELNVKHYKKTWDAIQSVPLAVSKQTRLNAEYNFDTAVITEKQAWINWQKQKLSLTKEGYYPAEKGAEAAMRLAKFNLDQTRIYSPSNGVVTNLLLKPKDSVAAGTKLFAVVNAQQSWIRARIKESFVSRIHKGDKVTVALRMYPFRFLQGTVISVGRGVNRQQNSAEVISSSLPYLSQSEDWIQLDQRFPVFIRLDNIPKDIKILIGASARILIHRHSTRKA